MFIEMGFLVFLATNVQTERYTIHRDANFYSYTNGHYNLNPWDLMLNVYLIMMMMIYLTAIW